MLLGVGALAPQKRSVLVARISHVISPIARRNRDAAGHHEVGCTRIASSIVGDSLTAANEFLRCPCAAQWISLAHSVSVQEGLDSTTPEFSEVRRSLHVAPPCVIRH
jgi:hypothetical protein